MFSLPTPRATAFSLAALLMAQLAGVAGVGLFVFVVSLILWKILASTMGLRVSSEEEMEGLDIGEHGNIAYPDFVSMATRGSSLMSSSAAAEATSAVRARELSKGTI
jgi:Amt family ammonium transporter